MSPYNTAAFTDSYQQQKAEIRLPDIGGLLAGVLRNYGHQSPAAMARKTERPFLNAFGGIANEKRSASRPSSKKKDARRQRRKERRRSRPDRGTVPSFPDMGKLTQILADNEVNPDS